MLRSPGSVPQTGGDFIMADTSNITIITLSQQYGSGGEQIAEKVALKFLWRLIGHEMVAQVAQQLGITHEEAEAYNERTTNFLDQFLFFMQFSTLEAVEAWAKLGITPVAPARQERLYRRALQRIILENARAGEVVMTGHDTQLLLANQPGVLHVRVVAPIEQRVRYAMQCEQLDEKHAYAYIQRKDQQLARYLWLQYRRTADDLPPYDLIIENDIHSIDVESMVEQICEALESKARSLVLIS